MSRERWLIRYCLIVGGCGWLWLLVIPQPPFMVPVLLLFGLFALLVDILGLRVPPGDPHSLVGAVLLTAALALDPVTGALIAAVEGAIFGLMLPFIYQMPRTTYTLVGRPVLRSGMRTLGILSGATLADILVSAWDLSDADAFLVLLTSLAVCYSILLQTGRWAREYIRGGRSGVQTWWRMSWRMALSTEIAPLPLAALGAAIYRLGLGYFLLAGIAVVAASASVRRAVLKLQTQRRSVRELALLNEVSRAIIRSELNVDALCELIYRETSKLVDTSSFHLGLFDNDDYTLVIRVQDRVRLPPLSVQLAVGDGIIGWMRKTGRSLLVEDFAKEMDQLPARPRYQSERPPRAGIYVPLIVGDGDKVLGSISIQSYRPNAFDTNDLRLLSLIADQAAVAITRARSFDETLRRANQLQAIREVSEQITAILDMDELLPAVVRRIRERFGYHPVHIFTIDSTNDLIRFRASTKPDVEQQHEQTQDIQVGQGLVGSAVVASQPILVGDVRQDARYINDNSATRSELAVPLRVGEEIIGVLDVQSELPNDFNDDDLFIMRTLANQIAIAIDSANSYMAQQEESWTLNTLLQISENLSLATTVAELLPTLVRLPPLFIGCDRCLYLHWEAEQASFVIVAAYGLTHQQRNLLLDQRCAVATTPILARIHDEPGPVRLMHAQEHRRDLPPIISLCKSGSLEVLPLRTRTTLLGVLILDHNAPDYTPLPRHKALYDGAIDQFAKALQSALLSEEAEEAERLEQELRVARDIQTTLLPANLPQLEGWEIAATWRSARLVGGDFYDFWQLSQSGAAPLAHEESNTSTPPAHTAKPILGFVIADVSDKGVPAALFMALARSLVRAAALDGSPPARALERANRWITRDSESGMFVTLFYALLNVETGELRYSCAGHNPPLVYHRSTQTFEELRTPGIALGVLEEVQLHEATVVLAPDDVLVCYTDGLTESINDKTEPFGTQRLRALIEHHHTESASAVMNAITDAIVHFTMGQNPFDDVTLVVLKRTSDGDKVP